MPSRREGPPDPLGKRALFWVPQSRDAGAEAALVEDDADADIEPDTELALHGEIHGEKPALYSAPLLVEASAEAESPLRGRGPFIVVCQRCEETSQVGPLDLLIFQLPLGMWLPRGRFDRRMTCPSCRTRAWCSVSLHRA